MYSITFGAGPTTVSAADIMQQVVQQIKSQELQKIEEFVHTEENKLLQGEPPSIYDFYA